MKANAILAVLAVLMSCGPAPELKRRPLTTSTGSEKLSDGRVNLDKKTPSEVLQIKYNNEVRLECSFRAANSPDKNLQEINPARLSWNLVTATDKSQVMAFNVEERHLEIEISQKMVVYGKYSTPAINGVHYELLHTPVVELTFRPLDNNLQQESVTATLFENLPEENFVLHFDGLINILSCSVKTQIAPLYEVEHQRIEEKKEEAAPQEEAAPTPVVEENSTPSPETV